MFNITTKYVKIGDERKKVFMVRGDEAYTKTTDTTLSFDSSTIVTGDIKGFKIPTITVNILRNIGSSKVYLYDGDEIIGEADITSSAHTTSFSNIYLSYDIDHYLYAVFKGNDACLGSKSKKQKINVELPSSITTNVAFTSPTTQINQGGDVALTITAKQNETNVADGTVVDVYLDGELLSSPTTTSGVATYTISNVSKGKHTITATIERTTSLNRGTASYNLSSGYDVFITEYPTPCIGGVNNTINVVVKDWLGNGINGGTVTLSNSSTGTLVNGIASISTTISSSGNYTATYSGTTSSPVTLILFTPSLITVNPTTNIVVRGQMLDIPIHVEGTGGGDGAEVTVTKGTTTSYHTLNYNRDTHYNYYGVGNGEVTLNMSIGTVSRSFTLYDYLVYWTPTKRYNLVVSSGNVTQSRSGLILSFIEDDYVSFDAKNSGIFEFDVVEVSGNSTYYFSLGNTEYLGATVNVGDHFKIVHSDSTLKLYINNSLYGSSTFVGVPSHWRFFQPNSGRLAINNLKMY